MFSKHVWYDRKHQAEVYITDEGVISGTLVAYEGAVCVINPRPEVLLALYQEAKIKRILAVKAVILTDNRMDFTRGLCAFVNYSRGLRRRSPLTIITRQGAHVSNNFLFSCCAKLLGDTPQFDVQFARVRAGASHRLGNGDVRFINVAATTPGVNPLLVVATDKQRTLHYYDETYRDLIENPMPGSLPTPNVVIRAGQLPAYSKQVLERLTTA